MTSTTRRSRYRRPGRDVALQLRVGVWGRDDLDTLSQNAVRVRRCVCCLRWRPLLTGFPPVEAGVGPVSVYCNICSKEIIEPARLAAEVHARFLAASDVALARARDRAIENLEALIEEAAERAAQADEIGALSGLAEAKAEIRRLRSRVRRVADGKLPPEEALACLTERSLLQRPTPVGQSSMSRRRSPRQSSRADK